LNKYQNISQKDILLKNQIQNHIFISIQLLAHILLEIILQDGIE